MSEITGFTTEIEQAWDEYNPSKIDHGFQWIGQSWNTCERCGKPAKDHPGMDVLKRGASPFPLSADNSEIVSWEEAVRRMPLAGAYGLLEATRG